MRLNRLFILVFILILIFSSGTVESQAIASPEVIGEPDTEVQSIPPHNLRDDFLPDLDDLGGASVYTIDFRIDEDDDLMRVDGSLEVIYTNQENAPLDRIYFRLFPNVAGDYLVVSDVVIDGRDVEPVMEYGNTGLRLDLDGLLLPDESITVFMRFDEVVPSEMGGNYGLFVFSDDILALDAFFPIIPVFNEEGWNVEAPPPNADMIFTDVAFFSVTVNTPDDFILAAGGREIERTEQEGRQVVTFQGGPQRDFYLAASPRFVSQSRDVNGVRVTSYFVEEYRPAGERVLEIGSDALVAFSERFGAYPYTELDLVSTPMQAGGMEYSSITALGIYFYDPESTIRGLPGSIFLEAATAHEVGHQWFYCQVMNDQIDEPWLDESLVQYATYLYYLDTYGQSGADNFKDSLYERWDRVQREPIPIGMRAAEYTPIEYGAIVYGRGALFFEALADEMGMDVFDQFIREYISAHRWGITGPDSLTMMAQDACDCDLAGLFSEWGIDK